MNRNLFRKSTLFLCCLFFPIAVAAIEKSNLSIDILAVSPRLMEIDQVGLFTRRSTGLSVVGIGEKCYLQAAIDIDFNDVSFSWIFTELPGGSQTTFLVPNNKITAFVPDLQGTYTVQLRVTDNITSTSADKTVRIHAATYAGVGGLTRDEPREPQCIVCHEDVTKQWRITRHANVMNFHLSGLRTGQYDESCIRCHTVGFDPNQTALNNGYHQALQETHLQVADIAQRINDAFRFNNDNDFNNDTNFFFTLEPPLRAKSNVQCENCHGPGSLHVDDLSRIGKTWDARVCAQCHDSQGFDGHPYPFDSSRHKTVSSIFQSQPSLMTSECARCHTAEGFARVTIKNESTFLPAIDEKLPGVSCVSCHDPHDRTIPQQLRWLDDVTLGSRHRFDEAGKGSLCVLCHQSRIDSDLETFIQTNSEGPHYGPQADVLLGIHAWDFGRGLENGQSVHMEVVNDNCVACHMAQIPDNGWNPEFGILVGGHSFRVTNTVELSQGTVSVSNHENACMSCHLTMTSVNRVLAEGQDYDGNGTVDGIQSEVRGLLDRLADEFLSRYPPMTKTSEGELLFSPSLFDQLSMNEKAVLHNYRLILRDGSFGIHNGRFTIEVLQKSYAALMNRSLKTDFPRAFLVGTASVPSWNQYE